MKVYMIKNYKQYNESIKSLLVGPTEEEEVIKGLIENMKTPDIMIEKCCKLDLLKGIEYLYNNYNLTEKDKKTGLYFASAYGSLNIVKYIVGKGIDINYENGAPLRSACRKGYTDIVKFLLDNGAITYLDAYQTASQYNHKECMDLVKKYLVDK